MGVVAHGWDGGVTTRDVLPARGVAACASIHAAVCFLEQLAHDDWWSVSSLVGERTGAIGTGTNLLLSTGAVGAKSMKHFRSCPRVSTVLTWSFASLQHWTSFQQFVPDLLWSLLPADSPRCSGPTLQTMLFLS